MRGTINRVNTRSLVALLGCLAWCATGVKASPIVANETFTTTGTVGATGVTGAPVVSFQGIDNGSFATGTSFDLGQFVVGAPPNGASTTYMNTPFTITFKTSTVDSAVPSPNGTPFTLDGSLNGTVTNGSSSDLHVNYDTWVPILEEGPPYPSVVVPFQTGNYTNFLELLSGGVQSPLLAEVNVTRIVPEPSSIVVFACGVGMLFRGLIRIKRS